MRIPILFSIVMIVATPESLVARIIESWTHQEMFEKADLVVIASVVSTKDTSERGTLLNNIPVVGVVTEFEISLILKGKQSAPTISLRHYRLQSDDDLMIVNGPRLIRLAKAQPTWLLFLTREPSGTYSPVTGQTDPAGISIIQLKQ